MSIHDWESQKSRAEHGIGGVNGLSWANRSISITLPEVQALVCFKEKNIKGANLAQIDSFKTDLALQLGEIEELRAMGMIEEYLLDACGNSLRALSVDTWDWWAGTLGLPTEDGVSDRTVQVHSGQHVDEFTEVCETMLSMSRREFLLSVDKIYGRLLPCIPGSFALLSKMGKKRCVSV